MQYYRRIPNLLLRQAIERTNTQRYLGADTVNGKPHDAFTFVMPDTQQVAVYVDNASGLVSKYELIFTDPLTGDEASEILFGDYVAQGKYRVPTTWQWRQAGDEISKFRLQVEINPGVTEESFAANYDYQRLDPAPTDFKQEVENLGGGVYVVHNVAGQNQNSMAVEFKDHIVVVEAPGSSDGADQVIARIKETIPNKPIRYVAMTHHHGDHIGGLRSFIAEGATVITTQANRATVEAMAAAPQVDRLAKNPRKPEFLFIERGKRVLSDGTQRLEFLEIGPAPHAKEMVIAHLPKQKVVFQGDLFFVPQNDAPQGPPQAGTVHFAKRVQELRLQIDKIAGVHGRTASAEEFAKATKQTS